MASSPPPGASLRVIEPIFEHEFEPRSFGFRQGLGCKDALREVDRHLQAGHFWVVDADLQNYFDTIPHARLLADKTHLGDCRVEGQGFEFLGYRFEAGKRWVRKKSLMSLRDKIRAKTKRNEGNSIDYVIASLNPTLRGWYGYFQHAHRFTFSTIDGFVRRRLRAMLRRQKHRPGKDDAYAIINNGRMPSSLILGYSRCQKPINWRANPDEETTDWRARRGKTAHRVRREGTVKAVPYPYPPTLRSPWISRKADMMR